MRETILYCHEVDGRNGKLFTHFYPHPKAVEMCGSLPILTAKVRELPEPRDGCYYAFWMNRDSSFHFVYPSRTLVSICFPYGIESAEEQGEGVCLPVEILVQ